MAKIPLKYWSRALAGIVLAGVAGVVLMAQERSSLREQQERFPRVRVAEQEKDAALRQVFKEKGLSYPPLVMLLRAFKKEAQLELWASSKTGRR